MNSRNNGIKRGDLKHQGPCISGLSITLLIHTKCVDIQTYQQTLHLSTSSSLESTKKPQVKYRLNEASVSLFCILNKLTFLMQHQYSWQIRTSAWPASYQYSTCTTLHDQHVISIVPALHCMNSMLSVQYLHYTAWPACYQYSTCTTLHEQQVISTVLALHCMTSMLSL